MDKITWPLLANSDKMNGGDRPGRQRTSAGSRRRRRRPTTPGSAKRRR